MHTHTHTHAHTPSDQNTSIVAMTENISQHRLNPPLSGHVPHMASNDRLTGWGPENGVEIEPPLNGEVSP